MDTTALAATQLTTLATDWGPRILAAGIILLVAYVVAKIVKFVLHKGIDKIIKKDDGKKAKEPTLGAQLGDLGYWLVLLIGLLAALNPLGLSQVMAPLQNLLNETFTYIPNLIGAGLIFVVGSMIAKLAQRVITGALTAMRADDWADKAGIDNITGQTGLSGAIGVLVYVLIIIPVSIAALEALQIEAISAPAVAVLSTILSALPNVLAASIVMAIAYFIGRWVANLVEQILPSVGFDKAIEGLGLLSGPGAASAKGKPSGMSPSKIVGNIVLAAILLFSAVEALRLLDFTSVAGMLSEVVELGSRVVFGGVIITAGILLSNMFAHMITRALGDHAGLAPTIVRWATIVLASAIGLRFTGLANDIINLAFGLILGSAAVAFALAFGLGGRDAAAKTLADMKKTAKKK